MASNIVGEVRLDSADDHPYVDVKREGDSTHAVVHLKTDSFGALRVVEIHRFSYPNANIYYSDLMEALDKLQPYVGKRIDRVVTFK